jgi:Flp pilus assembly protein TadG
MIGLWLVHRGERGAASVAQAALVAPILLTSLMLIVQVGLLFHARNVAEEAAQEGAAAGRRFDGSPNQAQTAARTYLGSLSDRTLQNRSVRATRTAQTATVTVTGTVLAVVPWLDLDVKESASGPVERYVPPPTP